MRALAILLICVSLPTLACTYQPESEFQPKDLAALLEYLNESDFGVDSSTPLWRTKAFGYSSTDRAIIDFEPHHGDRAIGTYARLSCVNDYRTGWTCEPPEERRLISLRDPEDRIDLEGNIDAEVAMEIVAFVRKEIVIDDSGKYEYHEFGEPKLSDSQLRFEYLRVATDGQYVLKVEGDTPCGAHLIVLERIECGLERCDFRIVSNELHHWV